MNRSNVTYMKISEKTGLSVSTVSRALKQPHLVKHATLKIIYRAIEELGGTLPDAVAPMTHDMRILAIVPVFNNPFYTDIVLGIQDAANQNGCQLLIVNETLSKFNIHQIINFISQSNISGVVIMQKLETDVLDQLKLRTPLVQCSEFNEVNDISYITIDNLEATRKMLRYILNAGRRQIALVNSDPARYTYAKLRLQGYCETLEQAGIAVNPLHIVTVPDGNFSTAVSAISALLKTAAPPDAIFCASDIMAAAALRACALEGFRVPQDIMVAGFDNIDISVMTTPNITTINQPRHDMGFMACTQLLSMIADPTKLPQRFILDTELIIRESTDF